MVLMAAAPTQGYCDTPATFKAWRVRLRLTQQQAADELNRSRMSISRYEKGEEPIPREIELACAALETGPLSLIRRSTRERVREK